jgi:hypothetical protein
MTYAPRLAISALLLLSVLSACAVGPTSFEPPAPVRELEAIHDVVRVSGLEERRFDHRHYWQVLDRVLSNEELFRVEELGRSAEGRAIRLVTFGSGPTPVLLWSQMHGDESTASMSLADIFRFVSARPENPVVSSILDNLTVHVIPMLNPDGAEQFQRHNAQGIDINRDARALVTPEGKILKAASDRLSPAVAFNLHDQGVGTRVGDSDRGAAIALLSPPFDESREVNDVRLRAIQLMGVIRGAIEPMVGDHIAKYDDTFNPRAFGDLITQWGASTILIESGGWEDDPQKQYLRRVNFVGILAALESLATGTYRDLGTGPYATLPSNGRRIGDLLITGGTMAVEGLPQYRADLLVAFDDPLTGIGGEIVEIGDLAEVEAMDTVSVVGRDDEEALDLEGGVQIRPGAPAVFLTAPQADGSQVVWRFDGDRPRGFLEQRR